MTENKALAPIGVFDSGLGGISVLREIYKLMPNERYYFFGDSKNAPYGTKSVAKVKALSEAIVEDFRSSDWNQLLNQLFCIKPILKS